MRKMSPETKIYNARSLYLQYISLHLIDMFLRQKSFVKLAPEATETSLFFWLYKNIPFTILFIEYKDMDANMKPETSILYSNVKAFFSNFRCNLSHMRRTKTQISLCICAVWSAPLLFPT